MSDRQTNLTLAATLIEIAKSMRTAVYGVDKRDPKRPNEPAASEVGYLSGYKPSELAAWKRGGLAMADFVETTGRSVHKRAGM